MSEIETLIPHRNPFLFIDKITSISENYIIGTRHFSLEKDPFFKGHFPEYPIVPGVILIEAMAQCGGAGIQKLGKIPCDHLFFLATVDSVKLRKPVYSGDTVQFEIVNEKITERMIKQSGKVYKKEKILCAQAKWMCLVGKAIKK